MPRPIKAVFFLLLIFLMGALPHAALSQPPEGAAPGPAKEVISPGEKLDLARCVDIALRAQPSIASAAGSLYAAQSRAFQAESNYYPQINASAGYSHNRSGPSTTRPEVTGSQSFDFYTGSLSLTQNLYDFGKVSEQVNVQRHNLESSRSDLENTRNQTAFNVKSAYYGVLLAQRSRDVASEAVVQFQQHLDQAKGFYEVGTKPKIDVTRAEVDLSNARVNLIKAENSLRLAVLNLKNSMGVPSAPPFEIVDDLAFKKYEINPEEALSRAFNNRPDLRSTFEKKRAAEENIELSRKGYYPSLSGSAAYNWSGETFPLERGWNIGATVTIPIFSGFLTRYQVEESKGNLNAASANLDALRQTVFLEVQQAYLSLMEAQERIPAAELAVKQAAENLELANGRYETGVGSPVEITDASVAYINARLVFFQALSDYKTAQASLQRAMGER